MEGKEKKVLIDVTILVFVNIIVGLEYPDHRMIIPFDFPIHKLIVMEGFGFQSVKHSNDKINKPDIGTMQVCVRNKQYCYNAQ